MIIATTVLLSVIAFSGCISDNKQSDVQKIPFLYVVESTGIEDNDYLYVDIQNIDTEEGEFTVEFTLTYIDPDMVGDGDYGGGSTEGNDEGIDYGFNAIFATISPHETERFRSPKRVPSGWEFGGWDYEVIPPYKTQ